METTPAELLPTQLRWVCDPAQFSFHTTAELTPLQEFIGQARAIKAIDFGLAVNQPGYNVFVSGMGGTGKASVVKAHLEQLVAARYGNAKQPSDWCYVHNFDDPDRAMVVELAGGQGKLFKQGLEDLESQLRDGIQKVFSSKEYQTERKRVAEKGQDASREIFEALERGAAKAGYAVQFSPTGIGIFPLVNGKPVTDEEVMAQLPPDAQRALIEKRADVVLLIDESLHRVHETEHATKTAMDNLDRQVAETTLAAPFDYLHGVYESVPSVLTFLERLRAFIGAHTDVFLQEAPGPERNHATQEGDALRQREVLLPFVVNVFVDNSGTKGPPVVIENNATFSNLFGRIDRRFLMGAYVTNHTMLKAGALQFANNGFLVLNMRSVLLNPLSWETLKRVIKAKAVRPEDPAEMLGLVTPQTVRPETMPLNVKIIVAGEAGLYHLLAAFDEDFWETFKVHADFDDQVESTPDNINAYAAFISGACTRQGLRHLDRAAVAKVAEYAARLVADRSKLSTRFGLINDLLVEADYCAGQTNTLLVTAAAVTQAIQGRVYRSDRIERHLQELTRKGLIKVETRGKALGQLNGLAVYSPGGIAFGRPSRISARTFMGRAGIVNIEREAALSGKTHNKGVLIIGGLLGWKYAQERPLALSATLAFEQSYEDVDGDSASSTEMYALLSSLADVPLRQDLAVTGSVDQNGEVQAIGGVNQKIEGFYDLCKLDGLTGSQGVLIPRSNVQNLMLREDVVDSVKARQFHIYAVGTIDEGIELLTGVKAGQRDATDRFPQGSVNQLVEQRLREYADRFVLASPDGVGSKVAL